MERLPFMSPNRLCGSSEEKTEHWLGLILASSVTGLLTAWHRTEQRHCAMCTSAAVRLVSGTRKYDRGLSQILHADLHWLDVADAWCVTVH